MSKLSSKLFNLSDKILEFVQRFENIPNKSPEIIVLILFPILIALFGYFHEPWFDEAQAWQIAKCASYKEIIFYLPHFEGHPPLWHLILSIFAKNHFPYEFTLKSLSFLFSYMGIILILFKSPFYRIIRVLLPFTYFLFYNSTIISRPYCMIMLAFSLLALCYYQKNEKQFRYMFAQMFISLTHPYLFVVSFFFTVLWFFESIKDKYIKSFKTIFCFLLLGIFYLILACIILPSPDSIAVNANFEGSIYENLLKAFLNRIADCFVTDIYAIKMPIFGYIFGAVIWFFIYYFTKNKKRVFLTFLVPYIPFALITTKYFCSQHLAVPFCFIIFICWIALLHPNRENPQNNVIRQCFCLFVVFSMAINLYWNFKSCILDIPTSFARGKKEAEFIKKYHLDNYKLMVEWATWKGENNTNLSGGWIAVAPYFEKNIFYNFNDGDTKRNYVLHKKMSKDEVNYTISKWAEKGMPDIIFGDFRGDKVSNYVLVYYEDIGFIHKGRVHNESPSTIKAEKNLAKKLGLKQIQPPKENKN